MTPFFGLQASKWPYNIPIALMQQSCLKSLRIEQTGAFCGKAHSFQSCTQDWEQALNCLHDQQACQRQPLPSVSQLRFAGHSSRHSTRCVHVSLALLVKFPTTLSVRAYLAQRMAHAASRCSLPCARLHHASLVWRSAEPPLWGQAESQWEPPHVGPHPPHALIGASPHGAHVMPGPWRCGSRQVGHWEGGFQRP